MTTNTQSHAQPTKILLATDLSTRSDRALDRASFLAKQWNAQLIVVHAIEGSDEDILAEMGTMPSWRAGTNAKPDLERRIRAEVRKMAPDATLVIKRGDPADIILETATAEKCDLIVTGVAHDESLAQFILGSTVDRILKNAPAPILIVKKRFFGPYRNIVAATDCSEPSRYALETAVRLFPQHVLSIFHAYDAPMSGLVSDGEAYKQQLREVAEKDCKAFIGLADLSAWTGRPPEILLEYGEPDRLLRDYVREKDIDLAVLGTHGRNAAFDFLIGGVARKLVNAIESDILLVRKGAAQ